MRTININLVGTFNLIRLAASAMAGHPQRRRRARRDRQHGVGGGVRRTDRAGRVQRRKAGVVGMTLPIARELARSGIRVMTIAPGIFETPMVASSRAAEVQQALGRMVPFPSRLGRPAEFASLVARNPDQRDAERRGRPPRRRNTNGAALTAPGECPPNPRPLPQQTRGASALDHRGYLCLPSRPMALLVVGSFGDLWLNTLLPSGFTLHWYRRCRRRSKLPARVRRGAFSRWPRSLALPVSRIGLPLAYAVFNAREAPRSGRWRACSYTDADRAAAAGARVRVHPGLLVGYAPLARQHLATGRRGPHRARPALFPADGRWPTCSASAWRGARGGRGVARQPGRLQRFLHIVLPALRHSILSGLIIVAALSIGEFQFSEPGRGLPQPHLSGRPAPGVLRRDGLRLRRHGDPVRTRTRRVGELGALSARGGGHATLGATAA